METKKIIVLVVSIISFAAGQNSQQVPAGTKGNNIELSLRNLSYSASENFTVEVKETSENFKFPSVKQIIPNVVKGEIKPLRFAFDVKTKAPIGLKEKIILTVTSESGKKWTKEILVEIIAPLIFEVNQNFPNPFNPSTSIHFQIPQTGKVTLNVFDILGKQVTTILNQEAEAGVHVVEWNAQSFASGVYIYRFEYCGNIVVKKMLLMK